MAIKRYTIEGYGQLELNQVAFRRDGRIEAQCKLNATDFASAPAENGMILAIDQIKREVILPNYTAASGDDPASWDDDLYALNYTAEHMYDDRANALKDFALTPGTFLPRLGFLAVGDKFTTNTVSYNDSEFAAAGAKTSDVVFEEAVANVATTALYGGLTTDGSITVSATKPIGGPILKVTKATTMPDGTFGIKFQVVAD